MTGLSPYMPFGIDLDGFGPLLGVDDVQSADSADKGPVVHRNSTYDGDVLGLSATPKPQGRSGKRNKPTLNCAACVERKIKCNRTRPSCYSCVERQVVCQYSRVANIRDSLRPARKRQSKVALPSDQTDAGPSQDTDSPFLSWPTQNDHGEEAPMSPPYSTTVEPAVAYTATLEKPSIRNVPRTEQPALFNLFGMSTQHPFHNYWTTTGGLSEVINGLPTKEQADSLVKSYYQVVDPLYPIVPFDDFSAAYENFWSLSLEEKYEAEASHVALQFAMFSLGTQHSDMRPLDQRKTMAEFYISCCHQALCISSYLHQSDLTALQTMVLVCNFLTTSYRISDAWTFSGATQRQAYAMWLNLNPETVAPRVSPAIKQLRCRLWHTIMFQDTSMSLYLGLPPATTHYEIQSSSLIRSGDRTPTMHEILPAIYVPGDLSSKSDISYLSAMWEYTSFVQTHICVPRSLRRPLVTDSAHKAQLVDRFKQLYDGFDAPFNSYDPRRFENQPERRLRQVISLSSNYFFSLMVLLMEKSPALDVHCDVYRSLEAGHEAMAAFFALVRLSPDLISSWGLRQTRAYTQATMIGTLLAAQSRTSDAGPRDLRLVLAKSDFDRYIELLARASGSEEFACVREKRLLDLNILRRSIEAV